jgi:hypothetical protein
VNPDRDRFRPDLLGVDLGPDAYRDDGRGAASDRHGFRPAEPRRDTALPGGDGGRADGRAIGRGHGRQPLEPSLRPRPDSRPRSADPVDDRRGAARSDRDLAGAGGDGIGPVPGSRRVAEPASAVPGDRGDDTLTQPLPVILPGATELRRPGPVEAPRGPFEPARPSQASPRPPSITGSVEPPPATLTSSPTPPRQMREAAAAKLDQIKDLYLTAEAIGEDALDKHFDQVSHRQRELIREFFERSKLPGEDHT